jgi:type I restriction enzyme, S subunit
VKKRNHHRMGYKETKVGWIPEDWEIAPLNQLVVREAPICYGILKPGPHIENGVPVIKVTDYINGRINEESLRRTAVSIDAVYKRSKVTDGDLLLAIRGSVGALAIVPSQLRGANITQDTARLRMKDTISREYLSHALRGKTLQRQIKLNTIGQAVKGINIAEVRRLLVPLPPFPEQNKTAEILSAWDEAIEQTHKLIEAKKRRKRALMQQLLASKKRLNGSTTSWREYRLGDLFIERNEINSGHLRLLAITGSRGVIPANEIVRKDASAQDKSSYKRIAPGDIGYNTMRMWQGVSAVSSLEGIVSPAYTICVPNAHVDVRFMGYLFKFPPVVHSFFRHSQGLVSDTWNLKFHHFLQIRVIIPGIDEQRRIADVLITVDSEIESLEKSLSALERQKRGLMQKLLTGEVRVKV